MKRKRIIDPDIVTTNFEKHTPQLNWQLTNKLREGQISLMKWIAYKASKVYDSGLTLEGEEWVSLYASNFDWVNLSHGTISAKTAYNRLKRMVEAGIIRKDFRGHKHPYCLWIPRWILLAEACPETFLKEYKNSKSSDLGPFEENLPHSSSGTVVIINNEVEMYTSEGKELEGILPGLSASAQELQEQHRNKGQEQGKLGQENEFPQTLVEKNGRQEPQEQRAGGAARPPAKRKGKLGPGTRPGNPDEVAHKTQRLAPGKSSSGSGPTPKKYLNYVILFWEFVKRTLYQHDTFSEEEERAIKNRIYCQVFGKFSGDWTDQEWQEYYHNCLERITMASQWINKSPDRFIPPPMKYFDCKFTHGFIRTYQWWVRSKLLRIQFRAMVELQKARKSMDSGKPPKGLKTPHMTRLQLYNYWQHRIARLGDQKALDTFLAYCGQGYYQTSTSNSARA